MKCDQPLNSTIIDVQSLWKGIINMMLEAQKCNVTVTHLSISTSLKRCIKVKCLDMIKFLVNHK